MWSLWQLWRLLRAWKMKLYEKIKWIRAQTRVFLVNFEPTSGTKWKMPLFLCVRVCVWQSRQKILAGSGGERNLPRCQSTTCIVVLWHSKHLECSLCFEGSSFLQKEITNQKGRQLCLRACKGGFVTARLPVWLPRPSGNFWDVGGEWKTLFPPFIFKWSSGNSLVILGRSHGMGLLLCEETLGQIR